MSGVRGGGGIIGSTILFTGKMGHNQGGLYKAADYSSTLGLFIGVLLLLDNLCGN